MRIVIDLQACQSTGSRHRGIGRYSLSLAKAMVQQAKRHEVYLLLSGQFPETIPNLRKEFYDLIPSERIVVWYTPKNVAENFEENRWRSCTAEIVREQMLHSLRPDVVHVTSLFEGSGDDAVSSIGILGDSIPTAVTLYDLIPYVYADQYLINPDQNKWYFRKLHSLKKAHLLLAISESSRQEGLKHLQLSSEKIINISSAVDDRFQLQTCSQQETKELLQRFGLQKPFVMYTGGIDIRKNIDNLILAYSLLSEEMRGQHQLAIVCSVHIQERERLFNYAHELGLSKSEIVLTGFVLDNDLPMLYQACKLFVFPSWHEGFGLPALEAMACGAPVIASNTSSLPEVIDLDEALFDPHDAHAIFQKINGALIDANYLHRLKQHGQQQAKKFSWEATATKAIVAIEKLHQKNAVVKNINEMTQSLNVKPKLAFVSPLPPVASGIANYSAELIIELDNFYDITLVVDQDEVSDPWIRANFPVKSDKWFAENAFQFERILYHFGNSPAHTYMYDLFDQHPGIMVLHDFYLGDSLAYLDMNHLYPGIWTKSLYQSHTYASLIELRDVKNHAALIAKYPTSLGLLDKATGVIVHSQYAIQLAEKWIPNRSHNLWTIIPHLRHSPQTIDRDKSRKNLLLKEDDFLLCSFGMLGATKCNQILLNACLNSGLMESLHFHLVFVGQNEAGEYGEQLQKMIAESGYEERIHITGFVDMDIYQQYLQAADVAVQLRSNSRGESSGAVLDCMAYGLPVIVNKNGTMAELPSEMIISLDNEFSQEQLQNAISRLHNDRSLRNKMSTQLRDFIRTERQPYKIAQQYYYAIEDFIKTAPNAYVRRSLAKIINVEAPQPSQEDVMDLAKCLSRNNSLRTQKMLWGDVSLWMSQSELLNEDKEKLEQIIQTTKKVRMEFIYRKNDQFYYARSWAADTLKLNLKMDDDIVEFNAGDYYLKLGAQFNISEASHLIKEEMSIAGVFMLNENSFQMNRFISQKEKNEIQCCIQNFA